MTGKYLVDLVDVLRAAGIGDVHPYPGWQTRARKSGGYADGRPWAIFWHHTASSETTTAKAAADYCTIYNEFAPVANIVLGPTGEIWVCAAGCTNTEGKGGPQTFSLGTIPKDSANTYAISIEAVNSGTGQVWPQRQIDQYFRINTALTRAYGLAPTDCATHTSWTPGRKVDPATAAAVRGPWSPRSINGSGSWSLDDIRSEAARRATPAPTPVPPTPPPPLSEEDDMVIYGLKDYANTWSQQGIHLSPETLNELVRQGAVVIESAFHGQHIKSLMAVSGLVEADLIPR